ncbi:hypothetical protein [Halovulum sp. GXIMD14793]
MIKVFGERNTGTRAVNAMLAGLDGLRRRLGAAPATDGSLEAAIEARFTGGWRKQYLEALRDTRITADDPWKHACAKLTPAMVEARVSTLFMLRDPYSWFLALARRPHHMKGPASDGLEAFADRPWITDRREGVPALVASPMDLWSLKLRSYLNFADDAYALGLRCAFLKFEDFVEDNTGSLQRALAHLHLPDQGLKPIRRNTKGEGLSADDLAAYYRDKRWQARLTAPLVTRLNARIDWAVAERLGYTRLDPADFPDKLDPLLAAAIRREMLDPKALLDRKTGAAAAA